MHSVTQAYDLNSRTEAENHSLYRNPLGLALLPAKSEFRFYKIRNKSDKCCLDEELVNIISLRLFGIVGFEC